MCNHYNVYLNIVSIDPAQLRQTHRVLNIDLSSLTRDSAEYPCARCNNQLSPFAFMFQTNELVFRVCMICIDWVFDMTMLASYVYSEKKTL